MILLHASILVSVATAQTAEEIIGKNIEARGGTEKLAAIHSMVVRTVEEASWGGKGSSVLSIMRPDRMRLYWEWRGGPKGPLLTMIWAFDGEIAWWADQHKGLQAPNKVTGDGVEEFRRMARHQFAESVGDFHKNGDTVELVGQDSVEGAQCYKIRFTNHGEVRYAYYDTQSFLVVQYEVIGHRKNKKDKEDVFRVAVSDYRWVNGILFPHKFRIDGIDASPFAVARGLPLGFAFVTKKNSMTSTIQTIEINPDMDENTFQIPGKATQEPGKQ
ncbi:MAG TPA: hypothetical protein VJN92_20275 [Candidatus Acidoferrum sp.]|nr:hypothetical protein [Candidatus Acidoferrum sp.]